MTAVVATERAPTRLFIAWQDPNSRAYHPVAVLRREVGNADAYYVFRYLKRAEGLDGFTPFVAFPDLHSEYRHHDLFWFFANRVMSPRRPDYPRFLETLDLPEDVGPIEILGRLGARADDTIEVFAEPEVDPDRQCMSARFFVRGIGHIDGAEHAIESLADGDRLQLAPDPTNQVNRLAIHVATKEGSTIGWVPDYLVDPLRRAVDDDLARAAVTAEHVNAPGTPRQTRVLCRLQVPVPPGFAPFEGADFVEIGVVTRVPHHYEVEYDAWLTRFPTSQARLRVYADRNYFQFFTASVDVSAVMRWGSSPGSFRRAIADLAVGEIKAAIISGEAPRVDDRLTAIDVRPNADEAIRRAEQLGGAEYREGEIVAEFDL